MSSKGYATPLRLEVGRNPLLQRIYLGMSLCTTLTLFILPIPLLASLALFTVMLGVMRRVWLVRAELGGNPVQLLWDGDEQWWWKDKDEYAVELLGDSYHSRRLAVLNFRLTDSGQIRSLVLTPMALGEELYRRMRVRFRITPKDSSSV